MFPGGVAGAAEDGHSFRSARMRRNIVSRLKAIAAQTRTNVPT